MNEKYIAERITELRLRKNVSEYRMSLDLGHSNSYIRSITSGKALPSMSELNIPSLSDTPDRKMSDTLTVKILHPFR